MVELAVYPTLSPAQDSPHGGASQPVANEDNISGLRSGILNKHASRELPGPIGGVDQNIPPTVDNEARLEETSSSSSEDDGHDVEETHRRRKSIEVQTNRTVTIFLTGMSYIRSPVPGTGFIIPKWSNCLS